MKIILLIVLSVFLLALAACDPVRSYEEARSRLIDNSLRCMWSGGVDCN